MKIRNLIPIALMAIPCLSSAQFFEQWARAYDGPPSGSDRANSIAVDKRGNTYTTGSSAQGATGVDFLTIKYPPNPAPGNGYLWATPAARNGSTDGTDIARSVVVDDNGDVYVCGEGQNGDAQTAGNRDFFVIKYNGATGVPIWTSTYDHNGQDDYATDLAINKDGHVFVVGTTQSTTGSPDILTIRYDQDGNIVSGWPVTHDDNNHNDLDVGVAIAVGPSDNVFITGQTSRGAGDVDWITIRYTGAGALQWKRYTHGTMEQIEKNDSPTDITVDTQNNVFVCGYVYNGDSNPDMGTVSFNVNGVDRWSVPGVDRPLEYSTRLGAGYDVATALDIEIDNTGAAINVYVTGYGEPVSSREYVTLGYSASVNTSVETWATTYAGPAAGGDEAQDVTVAGNGNVYVSGFSAGIGDGLDIATVKYNKSGAYQHEIRYTDHLAAAAALIDSCAGKTHVAGYRNTNSDDFWSILYTQQNRTNLPVTAFSLFRGQNLTGNLASLQSSDDSRMTIQPGPILGPGEYPVTLIIEGTLSVGLTVNELCLELEAHVSDANAIMQRVDFYNFTTASWVTMDERFATTAETTVHLAAQYNPNEFIYTPHVGNRTVKARVMYKQVSAVLHFPWTARIDFTGWHSVD